MVNIFLSHASEQRPDAEAIAFSLRGNGHAVFLDKDDLPPGHSYDVRIRNALKSSDLMLFLISPHSVAPGSYTLTELEFARHEWRKPHKRVLPVMARATATDTIPAFLRAVTWLEPQGNMVAEAVAAVERNYGRPSVYTALTIMSAIGVVAGLLNGWLMSVMFQIIWSGEAANLSTPLLLMLILGPGLVLGSGVGYAAWRWGGKNLSAFVKAASVPALGGIVTGLVSNSLQGEGMAAPPGSFEMLVRASLDGVILGASVFLGAAWAMPFLRRLDTFAFLVFAGGLMSVLSAIIAQYVDIPAHHIQSVLIAIGVFSALGLALSQRHDYP